MNAMTKFFCDAGELISHSIRSEGEFPRTSYIAVFVYEHGVAEYTGNGREGRWTFNITKED